MSDMTKRMGARAQRVPKKGELRRNALSRDGKSSEFGHVPQRFQESSQVDAGVPLDPS